MSKKILQFIVILLAVLIIICFVSLIVGMYLKIAGNQNNSQHNTKDFSLGLDNNEKIIDIIHDYEKTLLNNPENEGYKY